MLVYRHQGSPTLLSGKKLKKYCLEIFKNDSNSCKKLCHKISSNANIRKVLRILEVFKRVSFFIFLVNSIQRVIGLLQPIFSKK